MRIGAILAGIGGLLIITGIIMLNGSRAAGTVPVYASQNEQVTQAQWWPWWRARPTPTPTVRPTPTPYPTMTPAPTASPTPAGGQTRTYRRGSRYYQGGPTGPNPNNPANISYEAQAELTDTKTNGHIGYVHLHREGNDLVMDYDFDNPTTCKVTRITASATQVSDDMEERLRSGRPDDFDRSFDPGVRDAVIVLNTNYYLGGSLVRYVTSHVWFSCDDGSGQEAQLSAFDSARYPYIIYTPSGMDDPCRGPWTRSTPANPTGTPQPMGTCRVTYRQSTAVMPTPTPQYRTYPCRDNDP